MRLLRHIDRHPALCLIWAGAAALAALVAYQYATLYSAISTPIDARTERVARSSPPQPAAIPTRLDPVLTVAGATATPPAASDLTLHGVRQAGLKGGGSAIISQSGGAQRSLAPGERLSPGVVLKQVGSDYVIIARNGLDERLPLKAFESAEPPAAPAVRPAAPLTLTPAASPPTEIRPKARAPRRPSGFPARSIDFADPSTLPPSLTNQPAFPDRRSTSKR